MGHLAIVNSETIGKIDDRHPYVSFGGKLKTNDGKQKAKPLQTISDLFADALAVREGDRIFTWMVNKKNKAGVGFDRYYIANGDVVFAPSDTNYPIKIGVKEGYKYNKPVSEENALYLFRKKKLWNAIGKKSLRRGRSLSHQTLDEDRELLRLLEDANPGKKPRKIISTPHYKSSYNDISISKFGTEQSYKIDAVKKLNKININAIIIKNSQTI